MEITIFNPQKGRLETVDVEFTINNTTWFDYSENNDDIYMITDFESGLLICEFGYKYGYQYPTLIYEKSRKDIEFKAQKAKELKIMCSE